MITLRIEHPIPDFATWKRAFDRDPVDRRGAGVVRYSIYQPVEDQHYVLIDLEFESVDEAEKLRQALQQLWASGAAAPALAGEPKTRLLQSMEVTPT